MELFEQAISVRWADLDPNGHVRHSVFYEYGAQVRIAFLQKYGFDIDWMKRNQIGPVLFREEAKFYRELNSGDDLRIDMKLCRLSDDHRKWSLRHEIRRGEELCATLEMDGAWFDLKARRVVPPPRDLLEKFAYLNHTEDFSVTTSKKKVGF